MSEEREVTYETGQALKDEHDRVTHFFEVSARNDVQARVLDTAATLPLPALLRSSFTPTLSAPRLTSSSTRLLAWVC